MIRFGKYGRKISWIVKRYGKYGRKVSWRVKWFGKYGKKSKFNSENTRPVASHWQTLSMLYSILLYLNMSIKVMINSESMFRNNVLFA